MYSYAVEDCQGHCELRLACVSPALVPVHVGRVRVLRSLEYKGSLFAPFIPTTQLMLLFSSAVDSQGGLASVASDRIATFLRYLFDGDMSECNVCDAALCAQSGSALVVLSCASVMMTLQILDRAGNYAAQDASMRMSSLYVQCLPCNPHLCFRSCAARGRTLCTTSGTSDDKNSNNAVTSLMPLLTMSYFIPTCLICADRIETVITGADDEETSMCSCGREGRRCDCLQNSSCIVCRLFLSAQTTRVGAASGNTNSSATSNTDASQAVADVSSSRVTVTMNAASSCKVVGASKADTEKSKSKQSGSSHSTTGGVCEETSRGRGDGGGDANHRGHASSTGLSNIDRANHTRSSTRVGVVHTSMPDLPRHIRCEDCGQSGDPWVCMICGYVGCSRYQAMHAKEHGMRERHLFFMNLLTQQIWDYHSDNFVHRVIMNVDVADGHVARVQFPGRENRTALEGMMNSNDYEDGDDEGCGDGSRASVSCGALEKHALRGTLGNTCCAKSKGKHEKECCCGTSRVLYSSSFSKKCVNAKYDSTLHTVHAQYAMLIKSELDIMRASFERAAAHAAQRNLLCDSTGQDHDTDAADCANGRNSANAKSKTHTCIESKNTRHTSKLLTPRADECALDKGMGEKPLAHNTVRIASDSCGEADVVLRRATTRERHSNTLKVGGDGNDEEDAYASLRVLDLNGSAVCHGTALNGAAVAACYSWRNVQDEIQCLNQQLQQLEQDETELRTRMRATLADHIADELKVRKSIADLEDTLREIELNITTQRKIARCAASGDSMQQVVVVGERQARDTRGKARRKR